MTTAQPDVPSPLISAIDVSTWQGVIDWPAVAASGVRVAFIKASEGASGEHSRDARFGASYVGAVASGIHAIPYHFFTAADAAEQAANFVAALADVDITCSAAMLDLERSGSPGTDLGARALLWLAMVEAALSARPWVYVSPFFALGERFDRHPELAAYPLLLADWRVLAHPNETLRPPVPWETWAGRQTGTATVPGVRGACDVDVLRAMP